MASEIQEKQFRILTLSKAKLVRNNSIDAPSKPLKAPIHAGFVIPHSVRKTASYSAHLKRSTSTASTTIPTSSIG